MPETMTRERLAEMAASFVPKRKAFLAAHAADHQSVETVASYEAAEDALDELESAFRNLAQTDPDALLTILTPR